MAVAGHQRGRAVAANITPGGTKPPSWRTEITTSSGPVATSYEVGGGGAVDAVTLDRRQRRGGVRWAVVAAGGEAQDGEQEHGTEGVTHDRSDDRRSVMVPGP